MTRKDLLLVADGIFNIGLGGMLIFYPAQLIHALELPKVEIYFYVNILGAVLSGTGIALLMEGIAGKKGITGLGIGGAIPINLCAVGVLVYWLAFGDLEVSQKGAIILWSISIIVFLIIIVELISKIWKTEK